MQQQDQPGAIEPLDRMRRMGAEDIECGPAECRRLRAPLSRKRPASVIACRQRSGRYRGTGNDADARILRPCPRYAVRKRFVASSGSL